MVQQREIPPLTVSDYDLMARLVATEVDHSLRTSNPAVYEAMVAGIVDTVLNRMASDEYPDTLREVADQPSQFSAINGPRDRSYTVYGSVVNVPDSVVPAELRDTVTEYLDERMAGRPSSIGGGLNYANPHYSDDNNLAWINALDGPRIGVGDSVHYHGTVAGSTPVEAVLNASEEWRNQFAADQTRQQAVLAMLQTGSQEEIATLVASATGNQSVGLRGALDMFRGRVNLDDAALIASHGYTEEDMAAYAAERGVMSAEQIAALTPEAIEAGIEAGTYMRVGGDVIDLSAASFGPMSQRVMGTVSAELERLRTEDPTQYAAIAEEFRREYETAQTERRTAQAAQNARDGTIAGEQQGDDGNDLFGAMIFAMMAHSMGQPELAAQIMEQFNASPNGTSRDPGLSNGSGTVRTIQDDPVAVSQSMEELARNWDGEAVLHTLPVDAPIAVTSDLGRRSSPGGIGSTNHAGLDMAPRPYGATVRAVASADGVVTEIQGSDAGGYGRYVILTYPDGSTARYAHLASVESGLSIGDTVPRGESVGIIGNSGNSTGPHLHYELRASNGDLLNPAFVGFQYLTEGSTYDPAASMLAYNEMLAIRETQLAEAAAAAAAAEAGTPEAETPSAAAPATGISTAAFPDAVLSALAAINTNGDTIISAEEITGASESDIESAIDGLKSAGVTVEGAGYDGHTLQTALSNYERENAGPGVG